MVKKILLVLVIALLGFVGFASTRPDTFHVERSTKIAAPAEIVFAQIVDFHKWNAWSPWEKLDSAMKKTYGGTEGQKGHSYTWEGNKKVGKGSMTLTDVQPSTKVGLQVAFKEPWEATNEIVFALKAGDGATTVTWSMDGKNNLGSKIAGIFMNMDQMIGGDFEHGLADLKTVGEKAAADAAAAQKKADEEAAAAAAVAAAAAAAAAASAPGSAPASAP